MKYNSIGEQLIAKAQELDPNYKPDKFNDMSEAIDVILNNSSGGGYKIKPLKITENGLYDGEFEAYNPVIVDVPTESKSGSIKTVIDARQSCNSLFQANLRKNYNEYYYLYGDQSDLLKFNDTANSRSFNGMFQSQKYITAIPKMDFSNAGYGIRSDEYTGFYSFCEGCASLTRVPDMILYSPEGISFGRAFRGCTSLVHAPKITHNAKYIYLEEMFNGCTSLEDIPELDATRSSYSLDNCFKGCTSLKTIGFYGFTLPIDITDTALEHDALVAFLNQAGIAASSSYKITMGSAKLALLSDEEKAIATNKGWTLA